MGQKPPVKSSATRDEMADRHGAVRASYVLAWLTAASTVVYMIFSALTVSEMRRSNHLTEKAQALTLRPVVVLGEVRTAFMNKPGSPEERWQLRAQLVNSGPIPAQNAVIATAINTTEESMTLARPPAGEGSLILANGGFLLISETISKREALDKLGEAGAVYLHVNAWYIDQDDKPRFMRATALLDYVEGIRGPSWLTVKMTYD